MPTRPPEPSRTPVYVTFAIGVVLAIAFAVWKVKPREREEPDVAPAQGQTTQNR